MSSRVLLKVGNSLDLLKRLPDNSVDSLVTDPPYDLTNGKSAKGFMHQAWDGTGIAFNVAFWREIYRVMKPGAHFLAFGGTRTHHRMTCAIEDAGFEIRDELDWLYGSGFPKSLNIGKAIEATIRCGGSHSRKLRQTEQETGGASYTMKGRNNGILGDVVECPRKEWIPTTAEAQQWQGWGTALKPAREPIVMARKPLDGTAAQSVMKHGCGGLNIDGCRIELQPGQDDLSVDDSRSGQPLDTRDGQFGRWPANILFDEDAAAELDAQSGVSTSGQPRNDRGTGGIWSPGTNVPCGPQHGDTGGASRFFYVAKAGSEPDPIRWTG
jgi:hypothetical protein